jgi:phosphoribosylaminoimidazole-succinocarboxamide synthase
MSKVIFESSIKSLPLVSRGKVRDIYAVDGEHLLVITTDRLSAFDVVLPDPIPDKGHVLNAMSNFWFARLQHVVVNHLSGIAPESVVKGAGEAQEVAGRAVVVKRLKPLPVEAVVRGYIIGSGWKDYEQTGSLCGIALPRGLRLADKLPEVIFTPATKAAVGEHDENISFADMGARLGADVARAVREVAVRLYTEAADYALTRGIIIADTKFEFALDEGGKVVLIDEALTADSSRFWPADQYRPGTSPPSFDKQYVRDYLETLAWNKKPPAPSLPAEVIARTSAKYREAFERLAGVKLEA